MNIRKLRRKLGSRTARRMHTKVKGPNKRSRPRTRLAALKEAAK